MTWDLFNGRGAGRSDDERLLDEAARLSDLVADSALDAATGERALRRVLTQADAPGRPAAVRWQLLPLLGSAAAAAVVLVTAGGPPPRAAVTVRAAPAAAPLESAPPLESVGAPRPRGAVSACQQCHTRRLPAG